ncbi:MAG: glycosyltransferase [Candidatus Paceibacterota bacterium]|jgi:dolichol-phosphate mannosyltransferase
MKTTRDIIIIPTYNEKDNISKIIGRVSGLYPDLEIWVVDDSSPDGTASIVMEIMKSNPKVRLHVRKAKTGLGDAYKDTLVKIQKMNDVRYVITMDSDGSHNPIKIRELLDALQTVDLSIGSRYTRGGGGMKGMGMYRNFLSMGGNLYARMIIGFGINDSTAGFVAFRRTALDGIDIPRIASAGYSYQIEFKNALYDAGRSIKEVPITFIDREIGTSKMSGKIIAEGMLAPWRIAFRKTFRKPYFMKVLRNSLLASAVVCTLLFSLFRLSESPPVWYDEGIYIQNATNLIENGISGIRLSPNLITHVSKFSVGYPVIYPLAGVISVFGDDIFTERSLMIVFILALVITSCLLIKKLSGPNVALISLCLLATFPPLYGNGKSVLGETPGLLFVILSLLFIYLARTKIQSRKRYVILAGLAVGLAIATKPFFLILIPALIIGLFIGRKQLNLKKSDLYIGVVATIVPIVIWLTTQFQAGDSLTDIFSFYANPYHFNSLANVVFGNIKGLFTSVGSLYLMVIMATWLVSVGVKMKRRTLISTEEIIAFIFSIICILAYLRTSGMLRYIYPAQIVSLIFFPGAIASIFNVSVFSFRESLGKKMASVIISSMFLLLIVLGFYQICFNSWVAEAYGSNKTADWQNYFQRLPTNESVFFYNTPEVAIFIKTNNYYQYLEPAPGMKVGSEELDIIKQGKIDKIIIATNSVSKLDEKVLTKYHSTREFYKYSILEKNIMVKR